MQERLEQELVRLKAKMGLGGHLKVVWDPKSSSEGTHGMVRSSTILIFDVDLDEALRTLQHEFIEYILTSEFLESKLFEVKAHRRADNLVDIIAKLVTVNNEGD